MTLPEFVKETNRLARERADKVNEECRRGERLFGTEHRDYSESFLRIYFDRGCSPQDAVDLIWQGE